ncbi:hypothetical protein ACSBR1_004581 [Camellia fascicularis]
MSFFKSPLSLASSVDGSSSDRMGLSHHPSGEIHVIVGPMFAGKTTALLRRVESEENNGRQKFGDEAYAKLDVIGIDEAQFFGDLYDFCRKVADHDGKTVIVAGLDRDYLRILIYLAFIWEYFGASSWAASPEFWENPSTLLLPIVTANIHQENLVIVYQFVEHSAVHVPLDSVRVTLELVLLEKVTSVRKVGLTIDSRLEIVASIDLLKQLNASIPGMEEIGERARKGAMLLEDGQNRVNEGKNILFSTISEIPKHIK